MLTRSGNYMQAVGSGWLAYRLTGDPMAVGVLGFLALGPSIVVGPLGGWLADRWCPRRLAIVLSLLSAVGPAALAVTAATDRLTLPVLYGLTLVSAIPFAVNLPIRSIVTPFAVPGDLREQALADVSASNNLADLFGALAGGFIVQFVGPAPVYAFNAFALCVTALTLIASPVLQESCDQARAQETGSISAALRAGWRIPVVPITIFATVVFFVVLSPLEMLMPTLAGDHSEGAMALGLLLAAIVVGAAIGNPLLRHRIGDPRRNTATLLIGIGANAVAVVALGWSDSLLSDMAVLLLFGAGWEWVAVAASNSLQLQVPPSIAGRMVGLYTLLSVGGTALGSLLMGAQFSWWGVDPTLHLLGLFGLAAVAFLAWWRHRSLLVTPPVLEP